MRDALNLTFIYMYSIEICEQGELIISFSIKTIPVNVPNNIPGKVAVSGFVISIVGLQ